MNVALNIKLNFYLDSYGFHKIVTDTFFFNVLRDPKQTNLQLICYWSKNSQRKATEYFPQVFVLVGLCK